VIIIRKKFLVLCAAVALLLPALQAPAQDASSKPMLVISISSVQELADDAAYLIQLAEIPGGLDQQIPIMLGAFGQGLDTTKPIGAVVQAKGIGVEMIGFIPVTNFDVALALLEQTLGPAQDAGGGVYTIQTPLAPVFLKHSGNYAYIAQAKEQLANLPANPVKLLGGLEKQYDFAIQGNLQAVPELYLNLIETQLKTGIELGLQPLPGETDEQYETRRQITQNQMDEMLRMIDEIDSMTIGISIDRPAKNVHLDVAVVAIEGTKLAEESAELGDMETLFSGFLPEDAAITMNVSSKFAESDIATFEVMLGQVETEALTTLDNDTGLDSVQRAALKKALTDGMAVLSDTIKGEKVDLAASVSFNDSKMLAIGAIQVVGGKKLDTALQEVLKLAAEEPGAPAIKLNADIHKGVIFHSLSMPLPPDPTFTTVFGPALDVVIGVGNEGVYFGAGQGSLAAVKSAIDNSTEGKIVPSMQFSMSTTKLMKFAAAVIPDLPPEGRQVLERVAGLPGNDKISMTAEPIPNGSRVRIQLDEAAIKAIGVAGQAWTTLQQDPLGF
tara:strand:+ start:1674 stop:3341 length:1668 start_codon:yes stop_codon:yes gene_type:complete